MSLNIIQGKASYHHELHEPPTLNVPLLVILAATLIGLLLAVYTHGNVFAVQIATLRPNTGIQLPLSARYFRGLSISIFHRLVKVVLISKFSTEHYNLLGCFLLNTMAELLLSYLKVANIHAILDKHSTLLRFKLFFSLSAWSKLFPTILLYSTASSLCFYIPVYMIKLLGTGGGELGMSENKQFASIIATIGILYFGAVVPSYAVFIRVAASQGNESMNIRSAWQSFPWSARLRFFQVLGETLAYETGVCILLFLFVFAHFHPELHDDVFKFFVRYTG